MVKPSIDDIREIQNFSTLYQWNLSVETPPKKGDFSAAFANNGQPINLRCESAELPKLTGESFVVGIRGHKVKQPGIHTYQGTLTLTFAETVDNMITKMIKEWREICWETKTGKQNTKADVEAVLAIEQLNSVDEPIRKYKLVGCFLEDFDLGTLDATTSDAQKPSMILSYDYFEDEMLV